MDLTLDKPWRGLLALILSCFVLCSPIAALYSVQDDAELEARVKAAQAKIDAKNQIKGKVLIAKSALTLDVKPWEVCD